MGIAALKIRMMPVSIDTDIEKIKKNAEKIIQSKDAKLHSAEIEEIAFGLKALILTVVWHEEKDQSELEDALKKVPEVQSVEVIDFRRAFG
ncbi:MAG: elongation factor 1-beta [archaeon]